MNVVKINSSDKIKNRTSKIAVNSKNRPQGHEQRSKKTLRVSRRKRLKLFYFVSVFLIAVLGMAVSLAVLFRIDSVEIIGESRYEKNSILETCGINIGDNLILTDSKSSISYIEQSMPYLENTKIVKSIPSKLIIYVQESKPAQIIKILDKFVVVSSSGKILDITDSPVYDVATITGVELNEPKVATHISLRNSNQQKTLEDISRAIYTNKLQNINRIDLSDNSNVSLIYDNRVQILIGLPSDIDYKIRTAIAILNDKISKEEQGILDVSTSFTDSRSYFKPCCLLEQGIL